jgi:hypothetical protein
VAVCSGGVRWLYAVAVGSGKQCAAAACSGSVQWRCAVVMCSAVCLGGDTDADERSVQRRIRVNSSCKQHSSSCHSDQH